MIGECTMALSMSNNSTGPAEHQRLSSTLWFPVFVSIIATIFVNILYLGSPLFMLQVYDRVLSSKSMPTLLSLLFLTAVVLLFWGVLDGARRLIIIQSTRYACERLALKVADTAMFSDKDGQGRRIRDLDTLRGFLASSMPPSMMDAAFSPLLIATIFVLHPLLGITALVGALINFLIMVVAARSGRSNIEEMTKSIIQRATWEEIAKKNRHWLGALGMHRAILDRWNLYNQEVLAKQSEAATRSARFGSAARAVRLIEQALILGVGAYLVIGREATPGVMVAASLLSARALAPLDQVVSGWPSIVAAREAYRDLFSGGMESKAQSLLVLPCPQTSLEVKHLHYVRPGTADLLLVDINFRLNAGEAVGIIGPSGSGKSTLGKSVVGILRASRGEIRFDEGLIDHWSASERSKWMGYLPQEVTLLPGTIAENICRFGPPDDEKVVASAIAAGAHEMILGLKDGYNSLITSDGAVLSGGEKQRIGLARALYGSPFVLVLDEPSASLDAIGEKALNDAVEGLKKRGGLAVIMTHRPATLSSVDYVLVLKSGRQMSYGKKEAVLSNFVNVKRISGDGAGAYVESRSRK